MSLMHPALLSGLGLAIIPIVLHLLLRAKPKRLIFPALALIKQNRRQNVRRLQLRHFWLLLLRILVIVLIVVALTRPSLPAANYSFVWHEWLTLVCVIGLALGSYFGILAWWRKKPWLRNQFLTNRTMLRGGTAAATVVLLMLLLGWPYARRVSLEMKSPAPKVADNVPVAAAFIFDTSSSMSYRQSNKTRLQQAQEIAREQLSRFPSGSKVAVTGSHEPDSPAFSLDLQAARSKIDSSEIKPVGVPLNEKLRSLLLAQEDDRRRVTNEQSGPETQKSDRYLREIYLFTDLARSAWREEMSSLLRDELKRLDFVSVYLIDVGETAPINVGLSHLKLFRETIPAGGTLKLDALVSAVGNVKSEQTIELSLSGPGGALAKAAQQSISVEQGTQRQLTFEVPNSAATYQQGELRIVGSDPLQIDDVVYFTVHTLPPQRILIVSELPSVSRYWQAALDAMSDSKPKIADYQTTFRPASQLKSTELNQFDVVCLLNLSGPDDATWGKLRDFVEKGGGLAVFVGAHNAALSSTRQVNLIEPPAYNAKTAQQVLPARLLATLSPSPAPTMDLRNSQHSLLKRIDEIGALAEMGAAHIHKYWKVEPNDEAIVIAKYGDVRGLPALVEKRLGQGRVVLMTTGVDNVQWNELVGTPWYLVFADQLMQYLSQQTSLRFNYELGQEVSVPIDRNSKLTKVVVRMPDFRQRTQEIAADAQTLLFRDVTSQGSYQLDSVDGTADYHSGFSLNFPDRESDLRRMEKTDLDSLLGEGRYSVNRDLASLERNVQSGRLGQEVYSLIVAFLTIIFALEQFTSTWFYRTDEV